MYSLIRSLFFIIILTITLVIILTSKIKKKKIAVIIAVACLVVLHIIVTHIAFENLFYKFNSPEEVYRYVNTSEKGEIVDVVNAEKSAVVLSRESAQKYRILPVLKSGDKWVIDPSPKLKKRYVISNNDFLIEIYQYKKTDEYFLNITYIKENKQPIITDSLNSDFLIIKGDDLAFFYEYYAFIEAFDDNYSISINGTEITAKEIMNTPLS